MAETEGLRRETASVAEAGAPADAPPLVLARAVTLRGAVTLVIIGHRQVMLDLADQLVRIEDGRIVPRAEAAE